MVGAGFFRERERILASTKPLIGDVRHTHQTTRHTIGVPSTYMCTFAFRAREAGLLSGAPPWGPSRGEGFSGEIKDGAISKTCRQRSDQTSGCGGQKWSAGPDTGRQAGRNLELLLETG